MGNPVNRRARRKPKINRDDLTRPVVESGLVSQEQMDVMIKAGIEIAGQVDKLCANNHGFYRATQWRFYFDHRHSDKPWYDEIPGWLIDLVHAVVMALIRKYIK